MGVGSSTRIRKNAIKTPGPDTVEDDNIVGPIATEEVQTPAAANPEPFDSTVAMKKIQCDFCVTRNRIKNGEFPCFSSKDKNRMGLQCDDCFPDRATKSVIGLPRGFSILGECENCLIIFQDYSQFTKEFPGGRYTRGNVPVWKYFDVKNSWTIVRGLSPRINAPFIHVFLENCLDKIPGALNITQAEVDSMD